MNLEKQYDRIVLQNLLTISTELVEISQENPSGAIEQKQCFNGVRFNGKPRWEPPNKKTLNGQWDLKEQSTGKLEFTFTIDPLAFKKEMQAINKKIAAAEAAGKPLKDPKDLKPVPKVPLSEKQMKRPQATPL